LGLFRKRDPAWLEQYPPYEAPFAGPVSKLPPADAEANLRYLLANRESRLQILSNVLAQPRIDLASGMAASDPKPFLDELHEWTRKTFPEIFDRSVATLDVWRATSRTGREIVYSLLMDIAIALGECVIRHQKEYQWALDVDADNEEMDSYKRPVVLIPRGDPYPASIIFDPEAFIVGLYVSVPQPLFGRFNDLTRVVLEYTTGAHQRPWVQSGRKA